MTILDDEERGDPHDEIARLEDRVEELAAKIESCRKFILASRIAVAGGALTLAAIIFGFLRFDPGLMAAAVAALLGGIVAWGSNFSTANEATKETAALERRRSALIEQMELSDVTPRKLFSNGSSNGAAV